jgi:quercetin dioxygenase-like cupin family protein
MGDLQFCGPIMQSSGFFAGCAAPRVHGIFREITMHKSSAAFIFFCLLSSFAGGAAAHGAGLAKPELLLREVVQGMPRGAAQEVRVLKATFQPGERTVFHTHRSPVTVYVLEGEFTLELEGRLPLVVRAGQSYVEPPDVRMTGYNRSAKDPLRVVIFYVSDPGTPFLDEVRPAGAPQ